MTSAATSPDGSDTVYSRTQLLSLYSSPLVPSRLDGMKELADWYGEFTEPPSPPQQRHHLPTRPSDRGERGTPSRRPLQTDASNPFTNFGRFGVDGGLTLEEGAAAADRRRRGDISVVRGDKDLAPHLGGRLGGGGRARDGDDGGRTSPTRDRGGLFERGERRVAGERGERRGGDRRIDAGRERAEVSNMERALQTEMERRKAAEAAGGDVSKKEMRRGIGPADEGGWRNVGLSREEREKRLTRTNSSTASSTLDSRRDDSRREGGSRNDRDYGRNGTATGERESTGSFSPSDLRNGTSSRLGGRPSWMDDDGPSNSSGSSPAWMDAPANGQLSFGDGGVVQPKEEKKPAFTGNSKDAGGLDGIQAFKAQMKERERREMEQELRAAGIEPPKQDREEAREAARDENLNRAQASVFDILTGSSSSAKETKSIFEDLGITRPPPGLPLPGSRSTDESSQQQQGGGRGSRFAKFFDGKPPTTQASSPSISAAAPAPSVFGALMAGAGVSSGGGNDGAGGPSKEDAESMNRLLSMLQMGGSAKTSPSVQPQPTFQQVSPPPQPHSQPVSPPQPQSLPPPHSREPSASAANAGEGRSGSRRNFAKSAVSSPQVQQQQPPPQLPPPAFGGYGGPPGLASPAIDPRSPPQQARGPPPQHHDLGLSSPLPLPASHPQPHQLQQHSHQHPQHPQHLPNGANIPNNAFSPPPPPPPGMPPQFYTGPPPPHLLPGPNGGRFPPPPSNMPNMPPQFALGPDGRPIPPPPQGFSPGGFRNGPLSPPISSSGQPSPSPNNLGPNGLPPPVPPQYRLPPGGQPPFPPHGFFPNGAGGPPPPPPPGYGGPGFPPQFGGPPPPGSRGIPPPPQMFAGGGGGMGALGNPGVDLMALLNSGAGGQRIGPQGQRQ